MTAEFDTRSSAIAGTSLTVSGVGLGTWAIGGWMWGGTDEDESVKTIHAAVERGVNLIDTAPPMDLAAPKKSSGAPLPMEGCARAS